MRCERVISGVSMAVLLVQRSSSCLLKSLSLGVRYLPARGLDGEDRRLRLGHGEVSLERLAAGGAAQWIHTVDGEPLKKKKPESVAFPGFKTRLFPA